MPNQHPLPENPPFRREGARRNDLGERRRFHTWLGSGKPGRRASTRVSFSSALTNWAALVALWALPYLTLLDHLRLDASETLQWSLLVIGALGLISVLYTAWKETIDPAWRARHGLTLRKPPNRPHTGNAA